MKKKKSLKKKIKIGTSCKYSRICPKCGSNNVTTDYSNPAEWEMGAPTGYICKDCGFAGIIFPEIKQKCEKRIKKELSKNKNDTYERVNTGFGKGYAKGAGKIFGPLCIIVFITCLIISIKEKTIGPILYSIPVLLIGLILTYAGYFSKKDK